LVFDGFALAILSADLHGLAHGTFTLGFESGRLSLGQYFAPRNQCAVGMSIAETIERAGRMAGGGAFRPASGAGGIGGLDHGIEKCFIALFHFVDAVLLD